MQILITGQNQRTNFALEHRLTICEFGLGKSFYSGRTVYKCRCTRIAQLTAVMAWCFDLDPYLWKGKREDGFSLVPSIISPILCTYIVIRQQWAKNNTQHQNPCFKIKKKKKKEWSINFFPVVSNEVWTAQWFYLTKPLLPQILPHCIYFYWFLTIRQQNKANSHAAFFSGLKLSVGRSTSVYPCIYLKPH